MAGFYELRKAGKKIFFSRVSGEFFRHESRELFRPGFRECGNGRKYWRGRAGSRMAICRLMARDDLKARHFALFRLSDSW